MKFLLIYSAKILNSVLNGKNLDYSFEEFLSRNQKEINQKDFPKIKAIVFDTLRFLNSINFFLDNLIKVKNSNQIINSLLAVSINQLINSDHKDYVVINEAVKAAKEIDKKLFNFVNAVLRAFLRKRQDLEEKVEEDIESKYNFPIWWIKKFQKQYPKYWEKIITISNQKPPLTLRLNLNKILINEYLNLLHAKDIDYQILSDEALILKQTMSAFDIPGFMDGLVSVQDYGAQLGIRLLEINNSQKILDACAAPGGKTCHILEKYDVDLTAVDLNERRIDLVKENLYRLKLSANTYGGGLKKFNQNQDKDQFDRILLDVPCSGSGVIRRNIDIKWLRRKEDIDKLQKNQKNLLDMSWGLLKKGGKLLYVTCSIFSEENDDVINYFIKSHPDSEKININFPNNIICLDNQILPDQYNDGFYYCLLKKN